MSLLMSVSGVRGIVGQTLTPQLAVDLGCAFAAHVNGGRVVLGRDSRVSGPMVKSAVAAGLMAGGCRVVDLGIVSTPGAAIMVTECEAAGGIMITASHNPMPWNGVKFLTREGHAPFAAQAESILGIHRHRQFNLSTAEGVGHLERDGTTAERHVRRVLSTVDHSRIAARKFKVVLDSVHGAGGPSARMLLESLGCEVTHLYGDPTGRFPRNPEPTQENLTEICQIVRDRGADIGFAQDPDADRLAVIDQRGGYIGEEYTLVLAARQVLASRPGPIAVNLSTSRMIDDVAKGFGSQCIVHRTPTGEANVVQGMKAKNCVLGGEGNGGVIDPRVVHVRDSLAGMALILQHLTDEGVALSEVVGAIPRYDIVKTKFECSADRAERMVAAARKAFAAEKLDESDGLRIDWPDRWVQIRKSNTEPIVRIIAEGPGVEQARALVERVRAIAEAC